MAVSAVQVGVNTTTGYTSAANSYNTTIAATIEELGREGIDRTYLARGIDEYMGRVPFVEIVRDNNWLHQFTSIEDGASGATWGLGEYAVGNLATVEKGYVTTVIPVKQNANALFSQEEMVRNSSVTDQHFKMFIAEKVMKAMRDLADLVNDRFRNEILNKVDVDAAGNYTTTGGAAAGGANTYLCADGQPLLSATHAYNNGIYTFSNLIGPSVALDETALDSLRALEAGMQDSSGRRPLKYAYNTLIVAMGSTYEKNAIQLTGAADGMALARAHVAQAGAKTQDLYPVTNGQINIYQGSMTVVSVKGMDSNLWIAVDQTKEKPVKFYVTEDVYAAEKVHHENGAVLHPFFMFSEFHINASDGAAGLGAYMAGSRL